MADRTISGMSGPPLPASLVGEAAFLGGHIEGQRHVLNVLGTAWKTNESGAVPLDEAPECAELLCHHISESVISGVFRHPGPERVVAVRKVVPVCVQLTRQRAHSARRVTPVRCTATQPAGVKGARQTDGDFRVRELSSRSSATSSSPST
jgi:hypothetical protein